MVHIARCHFLHPNDNRRTLCGGLPAFRAPDPTAWPLKVTCSRCNAMLRRIAQSLDKVLMERCGLDGSTVLDHDEEVR